MIALQLSLKLKPFHKNFVSMTAFTFDMESDLWCFECPFSASLSLVRNIPGSNPTGPGIPRIPGNDCELSEKYSDLTWPSEWGGAILVAGWITDTTGFPAEVTGPTAGTTGAPVVTGVTAAVTIKPSGSSYT